MKTKLPLIAKVARILLGLIYAFAGLMGLLKGIPANAPLPPAALAFLTAIAGTGYFFPVLKLTELLGGLLCVSGFAAPFALILLAPITVQILLFHSILTPGAGNLILPVVLVVLHVTASMEFWHIYRPLFSSRRIK